MLILGNQVNCTTGFYCPKDSVEPVICRRKYYCPDSKTALRCPAGSYCPDGSNKPYSCLWASCPEGSADANKFGILILFLVFAILVWIAFKWSDKQQQIKHLKHVMDIKEIKDQGEKPVLDKLSRTFDIEFDNLGLVLGNGVEIMKGVTGKLRSGRTMAIMGPSGAGKTTFISLLTGKSKRTSGTILINGKEETLAKYKKLVGFVPQEGILLLTKDVMLRELTVRDILMHSARMRLPSDWSYARIKTKVLEIIATLGLDHVLDNVIGDEEKRGISGGQRKRVNMQVLYLIV